MFIETWVGLSMHTEILTVHEIYIKNGKCTKGEELKNEKWLQFEGNYATKILNNELIYNSNCWNFKKLYLQYNLNRKVHDIGSFLCMYYILYSVYMYMYIFFYAFNISIFLVRNLGLIL